MGGRVNCRWLRGPATTVTCNPRPSRRGLLLVNQNTPAHAHKIEHHLFRFHRPHTHLSSVFSNDWFALNAEAFARFSGTSVFLIGQTAVVVVWILLCIFGPYVHDAYPFILLNLAFSTQAAYAAPLILLAQTGQADWDKAHAIADAEHREDVHRASEERQPLEGGLANAARNEPIEGGSPVARHVKGLSRDLRHCGSASSPLPRARKGFREASGKHNGPQRRECTPEAAA